MMQTKLRNFEFTRSIFSGNVALSTGYAAAAATTTTTASTTTTTTTATTTASTKISKTLPN